MIGKNSVLRVTDIIFNSPTREFHARELSRLSGLSIFAVLEALKRLSKDGIISVSKKGNLKIAKASNSKSFIRAKRIRNLEKLYSSGLVDHLLHSYGTTEAIVLFGSYGRGDDIEKSDIDIAIITDDHKEQDLGKFEKILSRKISLHEIKLKEINKGFHNSLINGIVLEGAL